MGGKSKGHVITPEETMALIEQQQVMNNPNFSNMFGETSTTFGPDGQAQITQKPSEAMRGMIEQQQEFASDGPSQLNLSRDSYSDGMMNQFNSRVGQRAGFQPPPMGLDQMANLGQPTNVNAMEQDISRQAPPITNNPMSMEDNAPNNGVPIGDGSERFNLQDKIKQLGGIMSGQEKPDNALAQALLRYGSKK